MDQLVLVEQDPRIIDAQQERAGFMDDAGFDFETTDDADDEIVDRLDALADGEVPRHPDGDRCRHVSAVAARQVQAP